MAKELFGDSAVVFRESLTLEKYFSEVLAAVDVAIFDFDTSSAYGNALLLLYLGKKIYYPEHSVMYEGLSRNGACVYKIEDFDVNALSPQSEETVQNNVLFASKRFDLNWWREQWKGLFDLLDNDVEAVRG